MQFILSTERFSCPLIMIRWHYYPFIQVNETFVFLGCLFSLQVKSDPLILVSAYSENFVSF